MPVSEPRHAAILAFHKIGAPPAGGWETWNYVSVAAFRRYLAELRDEGYQVIDHEQFLSGMSDPDALPERPALVTFDDGYQTMLTVAEPILAAFGMPSVCFVPTDYVGGRNVWDHGNEPDEPICSWAELRELTKRGVAIQSHSTSHSDYAGLDRGQLAAEMRISKELLESEVGCAVETLAFPYGSNGREPDVTDELLAAAGYRAAFLYKGGRAALPVAQPFRMTRIPMGPDTNLIKWLRGER